MVIDIITLFSKSKRIFRPQRW